MNKLLHIIGTFISLMFCVVRIYNTDVARIREALYS